MHYMIHAPVGIRPLGMGLGLACGLIVDVGFKVIKGPG